MLAETRRRAIAEALRANGSIAVADVQSRFGVSPMTARRDLDELERRGVLRRTHGGAVLPTTSAHEDSFARRLRVETEAKERLAAEAVALLAPRETVFLDSSTTSYFVARQMVERGLPVDGAHEQPAGDGAGLQRGRHRRRADRRRRARCAGSRARSSGPFAVRTVEGHFADRLFLSVKGLTEQGVMTDADALEAEVKRTMIAQAGEATLLVDRSKLGVRGLSVVASVADVSGVLAHGLTDAEAAPLRAAGAPVTVVAGSPVG